MKNICNGALFLVKLHNWTCNLLKQLFYCKYFPVNINQISQKSFLTPLETYSGLLYDTSGKQFWLTASVTTIRKVIIFSFSKFLLYSTCKTETVWSRKFHRNPLATESSFFPGWQFLNLPYAENPDIIAEIKLTENLEKVSYLYLHILFLDALGNRNSCIHKAARIFSFLAPRIMLLSINCSVCEITKTQKPSIWKSKI